MNFLMTILFVIFILPIILGLIFYSYIKFKTKKYFNNNNEDKIYITKDSEEDIDNKIYLNTKDDNNE